MRLNPSHYLATAVVLSVSTKAASSASSSTPDLHPSEVSGAAQSGPLSWLWPFQRSTPSKSPSNNFALPDDVVLRDEESILDGTLDTRIIDFLQNGEFCFSSRSLDETLALFIPTYSSLRCQDS
ncbi:hypothetical protein E4T56_gene9525, partial [Termitomyces sp. T112]